MGLMLVRIDDRLIHGQVVEGWCKHCRINHIVVCNDTVARDEMQRTLLSLAVPSEIKISIYSIKQALKEIPSLENEKGNVMLLLSSPQDALRLVRKGLKVKTINVGGMHYSPGKVQVQKAISLGDDDLNAFEELDKLGVILEARIVPTDTKIRMN